MPDNQYLTVIKVWAALVWADGVVTKQEAAAIRRLISNADLGDADRDKALKLLEKPVTLDTAGLDKLDASAKEGVYRAAVKLSAVDDDIADTEIEFLTKLRKGLGIDDATAERIEDGVASAE